jgi:hypothetical protein
LINSATSPGCVLGRTPQRRLVEEIGRGVCDPYLRETECVRAGRGFDDVPDRELVANDQRDRLRPPQQTPQGVGVAADSVVEALSVRKALATPVLVFPSPVGADRLAVEAALSADSAWRAKMKKRID